MQDSDDVFSMFLNSRDSSGPNNYTLRWVLPDARINNMRGFDISLQKVYFTNTVYPINQYNNKLYVQYSDGGPTTTLTIPPNSYDGYQMAAMLKQKMDEGGVAHEFEVTYDPQCKKLTFRQVDLFTTYWAFADGENSIYRALGVGVIGVGYGPLNTVVGDYPVDLSGSRMVTILANLANSNYSTSTTSTVLDEIPLSTGFGTVISYESQTDDSYFVSTAQFQQIEFSLRDDSGNPWELPPNQHISFTLKVKPLHVYSSDVGHKRYKSPNISFY